jgi:uncharacterized membrane protein
VVIASVLDVISAARGSGGSGGHDTYRAATFVLMVGTAVLALTVCAGFADRARVSTRGTRARRAINLHAGIMIILGALCVADIVVRRHNYADASHTPGAVLMLTLTCLVFTVGGGALGGKLVHGASAVAASPRHPADAGGLSDPRTSGADLPGRDGACLSARPQSSS